MQNQKPATEDSEISLKDLVDFLRRNKRPILSWGAAGALISIAYVLVAPKVYEASMQLQMAQFLNGNAEEPAALIQRLRIPTSYPAEVQKICVLHPEEELKENLNGNLKVGTVKSVSNSVEMKVRAPSPEQAMQCAEAILAMIMTQQQSLIKDRLAGRQQQLEQYQKALFEEQQQLKTIQKADIGNFAYLAKLDRLTWLRTRIDALQEEAMLAQVHPAKLIAPIHVPKAPVAPRRGLTLVLGTLLAGMLGLMYSLGRETWRKAS